MQTRTIELPSDSHFAVAMKTQQEAERAEQQRIKSLVLNYDLQDTADPDGIPTNSQYLYFSHPNPNLPTGYLKQPNPRLETYDDPIQGPSGDKHHGASHHQHNASLHQLSSNSSSARPADKSGSNRSGQRARKLQLSDVDWYGKGPHSTPKSSFSSRGGRSAGTEWHRSVG
jgi:regulator of nonsense transcripts 2